MAIANFAENVNSSVAKILKHLENVIFESTPLEVPGGNPGSVYATYGDFVYETTYTDGGQTLNNFIVTRDGEFYMEILDIQVDVGDFLTAIAAENSGTDIGALETLFFGVDWNYHGNNNTDTLLSDMVSSDGIIINLTGDDEVYLNGGNDNFFLGDGDDFAHGGGGKDILRGGDGDDELHGGEGADTLYGQAGNDTLYGGAGKDTLKGGAGDDFLLGGAGSDKLVGGNGYDTASYTDEDQDGGTQGIDANLGTGTVVDTFGNTDTLTSVERIIGSVFDDNLLGGSGDDSLHGEDGDDTLKGKGGDDRLAGGEGDDIIKGGSGWDFSSYDWGGTQGIIVNLVTGVAIDQYGDTDTLSGIEGIRGSQFDDIIIGDDNNNALWGHQGDDVINAGGGDDEVAGSGGDDTIDGGDGWDIMHYDYDNQEGGTQGITLSLFTGEVTDAFGDHDTLSNIEEVWGSVFDDTLEGDNNDNTFFGKSGDDLILAAGGNDYLYGDDGDDTLHGGDGDDYLFDGSGSDLVTGEDGNDYISVTDDGEFDTFSGGAGVDMISYANFAEGVTIDLLTSTVTRNGIGIGDTILSFEDAQGSDGGGDTLYGTSGQNTLDGRAGDDFLHGRSGDDRLIGARGDDVIDGGAGHDVARYDYDDRNGGTQGIDANMTTGVVIDAFGDTDTLIDIEEIWGTVFADKIVGNDDENQMSGNQGNDVLKGKGGDDYLRGGDGADILKGGAGNDELDGGNGADTLKGGAGVDFFVASKGDDKFVGGSDVDTLSYQDSDNIGGTSGITLNLETGVATDTFGHTDTLSGIERIVGSIFDDTILGSASDDGIFGGSGNDTIKGKDGADNLQGDNGDDIISGGKGADIIFGGFGDDTLNGGKGADQLFAGRGGDTITGGAGADTFLFITGDGDDVITDFDAETDILDITGIIASIVEQGDDVLISYGADDTILLLDADISDFAPA